MRIAPLAALGLVLITVPALAQANSKPIFGSHTCMQPPVPCDESSGVSSAQWASYGDACLASGFGFKTKDSFFDDMAGLNDMNCLTSNPDIIARDIGLKIAPQCCVIKLQTGSCVIHCNLEEK